ncbi:MAG: hypothetical protein RSD27_01120 [Ruthenibacterium sp.]
MENEPRQTTAVLAAYHKRNYITRQILLLSAALILAAVIVLLMLFGPKAVFQDPNAAPTVSGQRSEEEIARQLKAQVDAGMFSCEINPAPVFANAQSEGLLAIRNGSSNAQDMRVSITLDSTGETVYTGGVLHPGEQKMEDRLASPLALGSYPATALVEVLMPATGEVTASLQMALTLTIQA